MSDAYIASAKATAARLEREAAERKANYRLDAAPARHMPSPAAPAREFRYTEPTTLHLDAADAPNGVRIPAAARAKARFRQENGWRKDAAEIHSGLVDLAARDRRYADDLARLEADRLAQRAQRDRELAKAGIVHTDSADGPSSAAAARVRMVVNQDFASHGPSPSGYTLESLAADRHHAATVRVDVAPAPVRSGSAAAARASMYNRKG